MAAFKHGIRVTEFETMRTGGSERGATVARATLLETSTADRPAADLTIRAMANHLALHSISQSLVEFLARIHAAFTPDPGTSALPAVGFEVLGSARFSDPEVEIKDKVTLYLHRIAPDNHPRNHRDGPSVGSVDLDLHYLATVWVDSAMSEQILMGWLIRELYCHPILDRRPLSNKAGWELAESISLVPENLSTEEMSRIWGPARRGCRLSFPFLARTVRIGGPPADGFKPTMASQCPPADDPREERIP